MSRQKVWCLQLLTAAISAMLRASIEKTAIFAKVEVYYFDKLLHRVFLSIYKLDISHEQFLRLLGIPCHVTVLKKRWTRISMEKKIQSTWAFYEQTQYFLFLSSIPKRTLKLQKVLGAWNIQVKQFLKWILTVKGVWSRFWSFFFRF